MLKRQRAGAIVQFSSIGGRVGVAPGLGSYQAAKFAVDGFTRVLASETAAFGIRYLTVEPVGFATENQRRAGVGIFLAGFNDLRGAQPTRAV